MSKLLLALLLMLILLGSGLFLFLSNRQFLTRSVDEISAPRPFSSINSPGTSSFTVFTVTSEIPNLKVSFVDEKVIRDYLAGKNVFNTPGVEVKIVTKTSKDPFLSQKDKEGSLIIESSLDVSNPVAKVEIALGDFVLSQNEEKIAQWINSHFWQAVDLLITYQTQTKQEIGGFPAFVVEKT